MWAEACWDRLLEDFLATQDPSKIMNVYQIFEPTGENEGVVTVPINKQALISSLGSYCLSGQSVQTGIIIDSDFVNYRSSKMKIRDLSFSNSVAGEGIIRWSVQDERGDKVDIEL
ncbi:hypothetical protein ACHAW5_003940 [Stephanodiscus triporus]|uniref:Uncharacterized protein n=1 Tax=Stephanodiscus triporus TaxID=2934178 RepID=A0ABD3NA45_9STRA